MQYVGSENVNRRRGDAEAARHCLPTLRVRKEREWGRICLIYRAKLFHFHELVIAVVVIALFFACLLLQTASKNMRAHKPKAVLGLNLKGVSLYDERSKVCVHVEKYDQILITINNY